VAREALWLPSFLMLLGFLPVASEAYGAHKPKATWTILAITVVCSFAYFLMSCTPSASSPDVQNLKMWNGDRSLTEGRARERLEELKKIEAEVEGEADYYRDRDLRRFRRHLSRERADIALVLDRRIEFQPHQLITHALLHDTRGLIRFIMHLGGNTLFLLVFGLRINELIGNLRMAIVYPLLAVSSALLDLWATRHGLWGSGLGASGAIAGLAGMYFIFFPVQRVRMIAYCNLWFLTAFMCLTKPFWIRGFWLLLLWFVWGDVVPVVVGWDDGTAHWAHLGGFCAGMVVALGLLLTRQVYARGDLLSVALGTRAWFFVGKPSRFNPEPRAAPAPAAPPTVAAQ
jgi:membrane associated rhomboid family serine protease